MFHGVKRLRFEIEKSRIGSQDKISNRYLVGYLQAQTVAVRSSFVKK